MQRITHENITTIPKPKYYEIDPKEVNSDVLLENVNDLILNAGDNAYGTILITAIKSRTRVCDKDTYYFDESTKLWIRYSDSCIISRLVLPTLEGCFQFYFDTKEDSIRKLESTKLNLVLSLQMAILNGEDAKELKAKLIRCNDEIKSIAGSITIITKLKNKINKLPFLKHVWEYAKSYLRVDDFIIKLNTSAHLLPILDCKVINLKTGEVLERTKEDYFSYECPVRYGIASKDIKEKLNTLIRDIFYLPKIVDGEKTFENSYEETFEIYLKEIYKMFGYCITKETKERKFFIWTSIGSSGKSTLLKALQKLLGDFAIIDNETFTTAKKSGPNPAYLNMQKGRVLMVNEPDPDDKLNVGTIKSVVGGDQFSARALFSNIIQKFELQTKIIFGLNDFPTLPNDQAFFDRLIVLRFFSRFVDSEYLEEQKDKFKFSNLNIKARDNNLIDDICTPEYLSAFLELCVEGAINWYKDGKLNFPSFVYKRVNEMRKETNIYEQFVEEVFDIVEGGRTSANDTYKYFKKWYEIKFEESKAPNNKAIADNLEKLGYEKFKSNIMYFRTLVFNQEKFDKLYLLNKSESNKIN